MANEIDSMVKLKTSDVENIETFLKTRLEEVFSKVVSTTVNPQTVKYKGGGFFHPYGFKAVVKTEAIGSDATVVKMSGSPKMKLLAYLTMIFAAILLAYGLTFPLQGFYGIIAAILLISAARMIRKQVSKKLKTVLDDVVVRFS